LDALGFMLNALYVCDTGDFWQPYFGGGVGAIQIRLDTKSAFLPLFSVAGSEWAFGYQGVAGINFPIDDTHGIFVGYRYQAAGDVDVEFLPDVEYASHNVMIGFVVSTN
jgi:opacity protein-like surface antigen